MISTATAHKIPSDTFDRLAQGGGGVHGVLRDGQRSKRLLLVSEVLAVARARAPRAFADAEAIAAFLLLVEDERRSRHRVDRLLLEPGLGAWATACLRRLDRAGAATSEDVGALVGHLGAVAAAAALRSGIAFDVAAYLRGGSVMLPTLGMVRLPGRDGWCRLRSTPRADGVEVSFGGTSTVAVPFRSTGSAACRDTRWLPLRRLRSSAGGLTISVRLDDIDPFRDCGQLRTAARLDATAVAGWQEMLDAAWHLLVEDDRELAEAIGHGVTSLIPLQPATAATELSATCHEAIGAVALTPPRKPLSLALALIHEFQHSKLWALLDLVPLVDSSPGKLHYAPWRPDPRPLQGLLHGTYAFLGLTAFWDRHRGRSTLADESAGFEFALVHSQVGAALRTLRDDPRLLPAGGRFVEGMRRGFTRLEPCTVAVRDRSLARLARLDHALAWRLRNVAPDRDAVEHLALAWTGGRSCPALGPPALTVRDGGGPMPSDGRLVLLRRRAALPAWVRGSDPADVAVSGADRLLVDGDHARAADAYGAQIDDDPDDLASWSGLALARRQARTAASSILLAWPETVRAVHRAIRARSGRAPAVDGLARWLTSGLGHRARRRPRP